MNEFYEVTTLRHLFSCLVKLTSGSDGKQNFVLIPLKENRKVTLLALKIGLITALKVENCNKEIRIYQSTSLFNWLNSVNDSEFVSKYQVIFEVLQGFPYCKNNAYEVLENLIEEKIFFKQMLNLKPFYFVSVK